MKSLLSKRVLWIAVPLLLVVGLVGGLLVLLPQVLATPLQIQISTGAAEAAAAAPATPPAEPSAPPTVSYPTRERVVNLADKGGYRYLKIEVVLDVVVPRARPGDKPLTGEAAKKFQEEVASELDPLKPRIEDALTTVLTSKTSEELMTADGKQRLKDELRAKLDRISVDHPIAGVYFTQFIIQ